jgi:outer membrane protein assembly factor BamB
MRSQLLSGLAALSFTVATLGAADGDKVTIIGKGHRFFAADYDKHTMLIVGADGKVEWSHHMDGGSHDAWMLPNGHILWTPSGDKVFDLDPKTDKQVLVYDAKTNGNEHADVQVHGITPLPDGGVVVFESGPKRILEIGSDGKIQKQIALTMEGDPHHNMRNARKLANGHYLLCLSHDKKISEVDGDGKEVWSYPTETECYSAVRLENGNTLIGGGFSHKVLEVDKAGTVVWSISETELPGISLGYVAQVQRLPNGDTIIDNCHAKEANPQLIEVDKDKKVVWSYRDFEHLGNATPVGFVLDVPGALR